MNLNLHKKSIRYKNIIKKVKLIQLCGDKFVFRVTKKCINFVILMMGGTDEEKLCFSQNHYCPLIHAQSLQLS
jgi:hypothetical protein